MLVRLKRHGVALAAKKPAKKAAPKKAKKAAKKHVRHRGALPPDPPVKKKLGR